MRRMKKIVMVNYRLRRNKFKISIYKIYKYKTKREKTNITTNKNKKYV